ncbi:MAG: class I SAM-dependent methyltransferase [Clostridia bacterium]|nr:class I SAM-dependent methyltransferase [Clostridia bacterium]
MGRGRDTLLLCNLSKEVYAFDIQKEAPLSTKALLDENNCTNARLILDSHHNLKDYVQEAKCVVFNLGFLPGGDHTIFSHSDTSIKAIEASLDIIKEDGFVSICSYYGGDTGFEERDNLLKFLEHLDGKKYTVMLHSFLNRPNCPPLFIIIEKNH